MIKKKVLDHGYVKLIRMDGNDRQIGQTAKICTDAETDEASDIKLARRLVKDRHTSPVEFVGLVVEIQMPIFVARQLMRHRTGAFNEFSMRYTEAPDIYYVPPKERYQAQSTFNKQGSAEYLGDEIAETLRKEIIDQSKSAYAAYQKMLSFDFTRELARCVLPVNFYTKVRWKIDLHNLMHFLKLREDPHAQWEVRQFAIAMHEIASECFPEAMKAYEDFIQNKIEVSPGLAAGLAAALSRLSDLDEDIELTSEELEFIRRYEDAPR
jgi:thymidylate synthase (FAD)